MSPLRIEVNGESTIWHPAERAIVYISVQSTGKTQEEVSQNITRASAEVRGLLSSLAKKDDKGEFSEDAAITHWSNSSLSTGSYVQYSNSMKKKAVVHQATMSFEAKFKDFSKLGSVATTLSTMEFVGISNVSWRLTDKTKQSLNAQCRHQAVRDAVEKARDFAAALDRPAPAVVEIRDSGASHTVYAQMAQPRGLLRSAAAEDSQEEIDLTPEDVSLNCSVSIVCEDRIT